MNSFKTIGVDKDFIHVPAVVFQDFKQFTGGDPIKVPDQLKMDVFAIIMGRYPEIRCHTITFL